MVSFDSTHPDLPHIITEEWLRDISTLEDYGGAAFYPWLNRKEGNLNRKEGNLGLNEISSEVCQCEVEHLDLVEYEDVSKSVSLGEMSATTATTPTNAIYTVREEYEICGVSPSKIFPTVGLQEVVARVLAAGTYVVQR